MASGELEVMTKKVNPDNPVAKLREQFWERKRTRKPSPLIREIYEQEKQKEQDRSREPKEGERKKIARGKDPEVGV